MLTFTLERVENGWRYGYQTPHESHDAVKQDNGEPLTLIVSEPGGKHFLITVVEAEK